MRSAMLWIAPILLGSQGIFALWVQGREILPAVPTLTLFPMEMGQWKEYRQDAIPADVQAELRADVTLSRGYYDAQTGAEAEVLVAWFQSQNHGDRQPHSPKVCLPGAGWTPEWSGDVHLDTSIGPLSASRYVVVKDAQRSEVWYWYQNPLRAIGGEWESKFWTVADGVRYGRTDVALVRIVVPHNQKGKWNASDEAAEFAKLLYPRMRGALPGLKAEMPQVALASMNF